MDIETFKNFLSSQEEAFRAILKACDNLSYKDLETTFEQHCARLQRIFRNNVEMEQPPSTPKTSRASFDPIKANSTPIRKKKSTPLKPGQVFGGSARMFKNPQKIFNVDDDHSSTGSPPESPTKKLDLPHRCRYQSTEPDSHREVTFNPGLRRGTQMSTPEGGFMVHGAQLDDSGSSRHGMIRQRDGIGDVTTASGRKDDRGSMYIESEQDDEDTQDECYDGGDGSPKKRKRVW
jgi:hypothetical protein